MSGQRPSHSIAGKDTMPVFKRKSGETLTLPSLNLEVAVLGVEGNWARLRISAPEPVAGYPHRAAIPLGSTAEEAPDTSIAASQDG